MVKKRDIGALFAIAIFSMAALSFHAYIGSMSRFLADDYCVAYYARHFGFLRSIWYWYISWSGTFSTSIFDWFLLIIKPEGIPFVTPVVLIVWALVTTFTVYLFLSKEISSRLKVLTSIAFGALTVFASLLISPDVPQSLYWWTGMRSYILPLVIFTLYWVFFQWLKIKGKKGSLLPGSILSFGILFIIGGFSETLTPVLVVFFIGMTILRLLNEKPGSADASFFCLLGGLLGALTSLIVMVAAPGNANRQAFYQPPPGIFGIFTISISAFLMFITNILMAPEKFGGILGVFLASLLFGSIIDHTNRTRPWIAPAILLAGIALTFGCFLPAAWGLSGAPPDRTLSIPGFILVVTLLIAGFTAGNQLSFYMAQHQLDTAQTGIMVITIACLGFSAWISIHNLYSTRQAYRDYAQKWEMVNRQIIQTKSAGNNVVHIPAMDSWTSLDKPNDNPRFWLNICYSKYYGIQILSP
jgi:hypothetical protein